MRMVVVPGVVMLMFLMFSVSCYDFSMLSFVPQTMFVAKNKSKSTDVSR